MAVVKRDPRACSVVVALVLPLDLELVARRRRIDGARRDVDRPHLELVLLRLELLELLRRVARLEVLLVDLALERQSARVDLADTAEARRRLALLLLAL